jgi:hypothetical protein
VKKIFVVFHRRGVTFDNVIVVLTVTVASRLDNVGFGTLAVASFPMEDSPLSITANVTGILTFAAAILAAIYVRYNTLRNGQLERATILKSVEDSCVDLEMLSRNNEFAVEQGDEPDVVWLKKLGASLLEKERHILDYCLDVQSLDKSELELFVDLLPDPSRLFNSRIFVRALVFIFTFGSTPTSIRWYRV